MASGDFYKGNCFSFFSLSFLKLSVLLCQTQPVIPTEMTIPPRNYHFNQLLKIESAMQEVTWQNDARKLPQRPYIYILQNCLPRLNNVNITSELER